MGLSGISEPSSGQEKGIIMKTTSVVVLLALCTSVSLAADPRNTFVSKDIGVSIEAPFSNEETQVHQVAIFFLPASDGFAANVNIQKQDFSGSIEAYDKLSVSQFESMGMAVTRRTIDGNALFYEYKGYNQGRELHWYSKAIKRGAHIYLATATGLESRWNEQKVELMNSVESFRVAR